MSLPEESTKLKILVQGIQNTGKSALVIQFIKNRFLEHYDPSVEGPFFKDVVIDDSTYKLNIYHSPAPRGYELEYNATLDQYIRTCDGYLFMFDVTSLHSFQFIDIGRKMALGVRKTDTFPMIAVGNKIDLPEREVSKEYASEKALEFNMPYIETSAKTKEGIEEAFITLVREIIAYKKAKEIEKKKKLNHKCYIL